MMFKKLIYLVCCIVVLSGALSGTAKADLLGWWRFDDGSGTTAMDSSGNGNDGVIEGDAQWVDGQLGGALEFNGSNARVVAPHIPLDSRSFSILMWVNPVLYTSEQIVFSQVQSNATDTSLHFRIYGPGSGRVRMGFYNNDLDTTTTLEDNNWYHITFWYDFENQNRRIYINGVLEAEASATPYLGTSGNTVIGMWDNTAQWFQGIIDDVQIYDYPLTENEIQAAMLGLEGYPYAANPVPKDGTLHFDTWISLNWRAGDFAVSHDVYFGDNFEDVNTGAESAFRGNQIDTFYVVGFPGFAFPDGLVPGTTYYWRIDEVNETEPNSPWRGKVWSFIIPPRIAYNPTPANGAKFIDPETDLSFTAGFGAKLHTVYFGDNFDDVNNAAGGSPQGTTTYDPGTLELKKTYYWRVDEFDAISTRKGNIWSFTTAGEGGGIKGEYFNNMDLSGTPALTRIDPQINFYWNPGPNPPPGINEDGFSVRWTGELEAPFSEPTTFITGSDDGVRMYLDGTLIINDWADHDRTETRSEPIELIEGHTYGIVVEGYENAGEAEWQLYWLSPSMPRQLVPQAALSPPIRASSPKPSNGAVDVSQISTLSWSPGDAAVSHQIYFGTDMDAVTNADTSSPEYKGSRDLGSESYDPGKLEWDVTYYWRVDEVEDGGTIQKGNVWSFTTANFLIVDDMESYNDINEGEPGSNRIYLAWIDGFDNPAVNGSTVGHLDPPFAEQTIVHSGNQSMPFTYNNGVGKSEATLTLTYPRDWTENGVDTLAIWYIGDAANDPETMYVVLNGTSGVDNPDQNAAQVEEWTEWRISLQQFNVNLTNVNTITIGFGNRTNPVAGGSGMMYFDDIRLLLPAP
jgi:hypothetical protein